MASVYRRWHGRHFEKRVFFEELEVIRQEAGLPDARFCVIAQIPTTTWYETIAWPRPRDRYT